MHALILDDNIIIVIGNNNAISKLNIIPMMSIKKNCNENRNLADHLERTMF